jgi:hypothetical protein
MEQPRCGGSYVSGNSRIRGIFDLWAGLSRGQATAFEFREMLNGACIDYSFDCHKNVVLVVMNRGKMRTCLWRIVISPMIPQDFPSGYH